MKRILLLIVVLVGAVSGALWFWARASLPPLDGELGMPGLKAPVEVLLDGHGVPHVYASGPEDAWFTAGVLHARDRFWQMELYRRAASGHLSEILGDETLRIDRRFLTLDLRAAAEAEWQAASPTVRATLTRYAEGVNAQMAQATGRHRPLELQLLGVTPEAWTPIDSLAVGRLLAWRLAENHQAELVRHALAVQFGADVALRLGGRYPASAPTVMQGPATRGGPALAGPATPVGPAAPVGGRLAALAEESESDRTWPEGLRWLEPSARRGGSNNWVIAGRRTASGRPLLANDPHLEMEFPGVWYEMHLVAVGLDVIGVSIPGAPFIVLGHNAHLAWGMTNTGADVQDLFVERINLASKQYLYRGQWLPMDITRTEIAVRGGEPQPFEVWRTRHGSVFAEVGLEWDDAPAWLSPQSDRTGERRAFTLRWDAASGEVAGAFEALNRARGWQEFTHAVERFAAPSQNFVYADIDGNIAYAMSGSLPLRSGGVGMLPGDGTRGDGEWNGRISASALPRLLNPEAGYITSSNNQIDRSWPGLITRDWALPYRTIRLHHVIASADRADLTQAAAWQNDVTGLAAADILDGLAGALTTARSRGVPDATINALEQLGQWDRQVDGRPVVTLYHLFEDALWRRTFADEMGAVLFDKFYEWAGAERPAGLYTILDEPSSRWFDDIGTIDRRETRDDVYMIAAADAAERFTREYGGDTPWSEVHAARFDHPLGGTAWPLAWLFNRGPAPLVGGTSTVMRASYHPLRPFAAWEVSSWRQLFDVGNWDAARVVLPAGQSGHPLSPHYFDQNEMWRLGHYRTQPFSRSAVDAAHAHRLLLLP